LENFDYAGRALDDAAAHQAATKEMQPRILPMARIKSGLFSIREIQI
jgi:hypothetical protein